MVVSGWCLHHELMALDPAFRQPDSPVVQLTFMLQLDFLH